MKKNDQDTSLINSDIASKKNLEIDKIKTTNVNILLNRVRLYQKRTLKKKIAFSIILAGFFIPSISALAAKFALFIGLLFYKEPYGFH